MSTSPTPYERSKVGVYNSVFKSGPMLISSKGLRWKSWKRRWFVLTEVSLVFYKNDPNSVSNGNETILPLGGIELNNLGNVLIKADKKLLTVLFPDGRAFTLKTESAEDLEEWKSSLEKAISAAPAADAIMRESGTFKGCSINTFDGSTNLGRSKKPVTSMIIGKPILLALEDIDGNPSFLEKALCFIEQHGVHVEGILRQSADVDEVEKRVFDYEQGKTEFGPYEDAHVIGDCIKHVLRELQSLPVPPSCCAALLEAQRNQHRESQILAMRTAIVEIFPEPNRRLLRRILKMMCTVVAHSAENRMTASAVAACMAPLLLKPLMTGDCNLENDSDISGDNSAQLLAAAAAASSAQAVITILLEEYNDIFEDEDSPMVQLSIDSCAQADGLASDAFSVGEKLQAHEEDAHDVDCNGYDAELREDPERVLSGSRSESSGNEGCDTRENHGVLVDEQFEEFYGKAQGYYSYPSTAWTRSINVEYSRETHEDHMENESTASTIGVDYLQWKRFYIEGTPKEMHTTIITNKTVKSPNLASSRRSASTNSNKTASTPIDASDRKSSIWGSSAVKKSPMHPTFDSSGDEELLIERLEATRNELRCKIEKEAKGNAALQRSLVRRKQALHERGLLLEQNVARLQEQLQAERKLRTATEIVLPITASRSSLVDNLDSKAQAEIEHIAAAEADVIRLKQRVAELHAQLCQQHRNQVNRPYGQETNQQGCSSQERELNMESENRSDRISTSEQPVSLLRSYWQESKVAVKPEKETTASLCKQTTSKDIVKSDRKILRLPLPSVPDRKQESAGTNRWCESSSIPSVRQGRTMSSHTSENVTIDTEARSVGENSADIKPSYASAHKHQAASSALAELTARLNFFKGRRSLLVEQLRNLDSSVIPES